MPEIYHGPEPSLLDGDTYPGPDGNPVQVGGIGNVLTRNHSGNVMTYNGTMHVTDKATYDKFMDKNERHWQLHEEGHIKQDFKVSDYPYYGLCAAFGAFWEYTSLSGRPSQRGPYGHDYNPVEENAERWAMQHDGIWEFGSPRDRYQW